MVQHPGEAASISQQVWVQVWVGESEHQWSMMLGVWVQAWVGESEHQWSMMLGVWVQVWVGESEHQWSMMLDKGLPCTRTCICLACLTWQACLGWPLEYLLLRKLLLLLLPGRLPLPGICKHTHTCLAHTHTHLPVVASLPGVASEASAAEEAAAAAKALARATPATVAAALAGWAVGMALEERPAMAHEERPAMAQSSVQRGQPGSMGVILCQERLRSGYTKSSSLTL
eukprot:1143508-Pelagomonas_calceolata.AAC.8